MLQGLMVVGMAWLAANLQGCGDDGGDKGSEVVTSMTMTTSPAPHDDGGDTGSEVVTSMTMTTSPAPHEHEHPPPCTGPHEPPLPGVMPGKDMPKIILGQDIDWPPYAFLGVPPMSDLEVEGFGKDIAMGLESVCNISMHVVQTAWSKCWGSGVIGSGVRDGHVHGCMTYTHTMGERNRFMEFSKPVLEHNKPGGIIVRLDSNGNPEFNGAHNLTGLKVVDVVGWAPTADTVRLVENKCTKQRFASDLQIITPTVSTGNANNDALQTLMNGDADAMWVYADQAKNYQCTDGMTPNWNCTLWGGWGTTFAYIQTGLLGHAQGGTTLSMSKKGSGLPAILNPCIDLFLETKAYYDLCVKHGFTESCFKNSHFPNTTYATPTYLKATDTLSTACADGYCPCPTV